MRFLCDLLCIKKSAREPNKMRDLFNNSKASKVEVGDEPKSLRKEISEFVKQIGENIDPETLKILKQTTRDLLDSDIGKTSLKVQSTIPTFELPTVEGNMVKSTELLEKSGFTLIIFYRGKWCPFCNMELMAYQRLLPKFEAAEVNVVAISANLPEVGLKFKSMKNFGFSVLSDVGLVVARKFGIVFELAKELRPIYLMWDLNIPEENGDDSWNLPIASKFLVDNRSGKVIHRFVEADYHERPEPQDFLDVVEMHTNRFEENA